MPLATGTWFPNEPRPLQLDVVLSNAYAFGGCNASLVLRRVAE